MERSSEKPKVPFWSIAEAGQPTRPIFGYPTFNYSPICNKEHEKNRDPLRNHGADHMWGVLYQDVLLSGKQPGLPDNEFELAKVINKKEANDENHEKVQKAMTYGFKLKEHSVDAHTNKLIQLKDNKILKMKKLKQQEADNELINLQLGNGKFSPGVKGGKSPISPNRTNGTIHTS